MIKFIDSFFTNILAGTTLLASDVLDVKVLSCTPLHDKNVPFLACAWHGVLHGTPDGGIFPALGAERCCGWSTNASSTTLLDETVVVQEDSGKGCTSNAGSRHRAEGRRPGTTWQERREAISGGAV